MIGFIKSWSSLIKRLTGINTIFGGRATKLAGINDFQCISDETSLTFISPNMITFSGPIPAFLQNMTGTGKVFKVTFGGGPNNGSVFRMTGLSGNTVTVSSSPVYNFTGPATLDGRIWIVINDERIAKSTSTGSTMYNVHNRQNSVLGNDASEVAYVFAEHYHLENEEEKPIDEIVFHQYNEIGEHSMITSSCSSHSFDIGPLVIVDSCGNAVRTQGSLTNPVDLCFPYPSKCPGQTCKVDL